MTGARDRKRAERQKRKRRSAERPSVPVEAQPAAATEERNGDQAPSETFQERMARRYEERNDEARAKLEPLEPGERPTAVTVGAIVAGVLAVIFTVSAVLAIAGVECGRPRDQARSDRRLRDRPLGDDHRACGAPATGPCSASRPCSC